VRLVADERSAELQRTDERYVSLSMVTRTS
jgi:hypothetical protein